MGIGFFTFAVLASFVATSTARSIAGLYIVYLK